MPIIKFETVVIYDEDGPVGVIYGQNSELLKTLQKTEFWEHIQEELDERNVIPNDIESINELYKIIENESHNYTYRIKLFEDQHYHRPKKINN